MSITEDHTEVEEQGADAPEVEGASVLDSIRARRRELQQERHLDIDLPGYGGELVARFTPVEWERIKKIGTKKRTGADKRLEELYIAAETIAAATDEIMVRRPGGDLVTMASMIGSEEPIRFDKQLARFFDLGDLPAGRAVVLAVIANDLAVSGVHQELFLWMQGADEEVDGDLLGESKGLRS